MRSAEQRSKEMTKIQLNIPTLIQDLATGALAVALVVILI